MIGIEYKGISGIYRISTLRDKRCYVGSAKSLYNRVQCHRTNLRKQKHHSQYLQRFVDKYGLEMLVFEVVQICDVKDLLRHEQYWIDRLRPEFNTVPLAGNTLGYKHTTEGRRKMSAAGKGKRRSLGRKLSAETKQKIANAHKGKPLHPNFITASIKANTGRKQSPDEIRKRQLAQKKVNRQDAREIWMASKLGVYQKDIAKAFNISQRLVCRVLHGIGIYAEYKQLDKDYFEAQEKRFADHIAQPKLFAPEPTPVTQEAMFV